MQRPGHSWMRWNLREEEGGIRRNPVAPVLPHGGDQASGPSTASPPIYFLVAHSACAVPCAGPHQTSIVANGVLLRGEAGGVG